MGKVTVTRAFTILVEATEEEAVGLINGLGFLINDNRGSQFLDELRNAIIDQMED